MIKRKKKKKEMLNYDIEKDFEFLNNLTFKEGVVKIFAVLLIICLNWTGLLQIGKTFAYFNDTEQSLGNIYSAGTLDFSLTNNYIENLIGIEALSEIEFASVITKTIGSLDIRYEVYAEKIAGSNDDFCNALIAEIKHNGVEKHDNPLLPLSVLSTTQLGTWEFEIDLPVSATNVLHGAKCNIDLVFKGWRSDVANFEESGFTDEERIELRFTSRMIVLNEFLPNPDSLAWGLNFGEDGDSMPKGEWIEIYNNSDFSYDLDGWYIWDSSADDLNKIFITNSNTDLGTTIIPGNSWLVVYMNREVFDNDGDAVKLFDNTDTLIDSYVYAGHDHCELEPTPGDENSGSTGEGSCEEVPPNKSYARIPDGIGDWEDPIPTPGRPNTLEPVLFKIPKIEIEKEILEVPEVLITETTAPAVGGALPILGPQPESELIPETTIPSNEPAAEFEPEEPAAIEESEEIQEDAEGEEIIEEAIEVEEESVPEEEPVLEEPVIKEEPVVMEEPAPAEEPESPENSENQNVEENQENI